MVAPARSDEEEAMSTAEPLSEDQWPATGVDLEGRRRRILATGPRSAVPQKSRSSNRRSLPRLGVSDGPFHGRPVPVREALTCRRGNTEGTCVRPLDTP